MLKHVKTQGCLRYETPLSRTELKRVGSKPAASTSIGATTEHPGDSWNGPFLSFSGTIQGFQPSDLQMFAVLFFKNPVPLRFPRSLKSCLTIDDSNRVRRCQERKHFALKHAGAHLVPLWSSLAFVWWKRDEAGDFHKLKECPTVTRVDLETNRNIHSYEQRPETEPFACQRLQNGVINYTTGHNW